MQHSFELALIGPVQVRVPRWAIYLLLLIRVKVRASQESSHRELCEYEVRVSTVVSILTHLQAGLERNRNHAKIVCIRCSSFQEKY